MLNYPTVEVQAVVIEILALESANNPEVLADLIALLDFPESGIRARALAALRWAGPGKKDAVQAAVRRLGDPDSNVRIEAATTVAVLGGDGRAEALAILRAALKNPDTLALVPLAARGLALFGPTAADAVPELIPLLARHNAEVRTSVAEALGRIGKSAKPAVPALTKMLDDPDPRVKAVVAVALWRITGDSKLSVQAISTAVADPALGRPFDDPRLTSEPALRQDVPGPVPGFRSSPTGPRDTTRVSVIRALGEIGPDAKPATDALRSALRDPDPKVRSAATEAFKKIAKP
jgi:HEAT repeat protein